MANNAGNPEKPKRSSIRLILLVVILLVVGLAAGYMFLGPHRQALAAVDEIHEKNAAAPVSAQKDKQQDDVLVHDAIGREPDDRQAKENAYILETYEFGPKLTFTDNYKLYVLYMVRPKRGVTLHRYQYEPFDEDELPLGPVDLPGLGNDSNGDETAEGEETSEGDEKGSTDGGSPDGDAE